MTIFVYPAGVYVSLISRHDLNSWDFTSQPVSNPRCEIECGVKTRRSPMDRMIEIRRIPERVMEKNEKPENSFVMNQTADPRPRNATEPTHMHHSRPEYGSKNQLVPTRGVVFHRSARLLRRVPRGSCSNRASALWMSRYLMRHPGQKDAGWRSSSPVPCTTSAPVIMAAAIVSADGQQAMPEHDRDFARGRMLAVLAPLRTKIGPDPR